MKTTSFNNGRSNSSSLFRRGIGGVSFFFLLFLLLFASCDDLEDTDTPSGGDDGMPAETGTAELYILSEGLFNLNNSSLALYSFKNNQLNTDYFRSINRRGLGDTANDMGIYGSKTLYRDQCIEPDRSGRPAKRQVCQADTHAVRKRKFPATPQHRFRRRQGIRVFLRRNSGANRYCLLFPSTH